LRTLLAAALAELACSSVFTVARPAERSLTASANVSTALARLSSPCLSFFTSDSVVTRSPLRVVVGVSLNDPRRTGQPNTRASATVTRTVTPVAESGSWVATTTPLRW
jgi:hypothetical protein